MFRTDLSDQRRLFAFTQRELIPLTSDVWLYIDLFDALDLSEFLGDYSTRGEEAVHPTLMLRTIFYGLTHGVATGRKLQEACSFDSRFVVLSGEQAPSYRTFYRFVFRHQGRFSALFAQVVQLAQRMGLASLGRVAIDGTRMKANTSRSKAMSYERMQKAVTQICAELAALRADLAKENGKEKTGSNLPAEIVLREKRLAKIKAAKESIERDAGGAKVEPKTQKSFADLDALPMFKPKDGFQYGYNCQAAVDGDHQIIVAAELHDSVNDSGALPSVLAGVEQCSGKNPSEVLADSGYRSVGNLDTVATRGATALIALGKGESEGGGRHGYLRDLRFHPQGQGHYRCPRSKVLPRKFTRTSGHTSLILPKSHCRDCPLQKRCALYAKRGKVFEVPPENQRRLLIDLQERMRSEEGRKIYRRRKAIVEPVFGNIKNKKLRIGVRGAVKVACWWKIVATAHNLEKIVGARRVHKRAP